MAVVERILPEPEGASLSIRVLDQFSTGILEGQDSLRVLVGNRVVFAGHVDLLRRVRAGRVALAGRVVEGVAEETTAGESAPKTLVPNREDDELIDQVRVISHTGERIDVEVRQEILATWQLPAGHHVDGHIHVQLRFDPVE